MSQCTGNCKIKGFILEWCETCGWDDGFTGTTDFDSTTKNTHNMAKTIYLAGKVTGLPPAEVHKKFRFAQARLEQNGHRVFNPVEHVTINDMLEHSWEDIMKVCLAEMFRCDEVHLLPCWNDSRGATLERDIAIRLGMKIVYH